MTYDEAVEEIRNKAVAQRAGNFALFKNAFGIQRFHLLFEEHNLGFVSAPYRIARIEFRMCDDSSLYWEVTVVPHSKRYEAELAHFQPLRVAHYDAPYALGILYTQIDNIINSRLPDLPKELNVQDGG